MKKKNKKLDYLYLYLIIIVICGSFACMTDSCAGQCDAEKLECPDCVDQWWANPPDDCVDEENVNLGHGNITVAGKVVGLRLGHIRLAGKVNIKEHSGNFFWTKEYNRACCSLPDRLLDKWGGWFKESTIFKGGCHVIPAGVFWYENLGEWREYTFKFQQNDSNYADEFHVVYTQTFIFDDEDEDNKEPATHLEFQVPGKVNFESYFMDPLDWRVNINFNYNKGIVLTTITPGKINYLGDDPCNLETGYLGDSYHGKKDCKAQLIPIDGTGNGKGPYYGFFREGFDICNKVPTINPDHHWTTAQQYNWQDIVDGAAMYREVSPGRYLLKTFHRNDKEQYIQPLYLKVEKGKITNACPPAGAQYRGSMYVSAVKARGLDHSGGRLYRWVKIDKDGNMTPLMTNFENIENRMIPLGQDSIKPGDHLYLETNLAGNVLINGDVRFKFYNHGDHYDIDDNLKLYSVRFLRQGNNVFVQDTEGRRETLANYQINDIVYNGLGDTDCLDFFHNGENYINTSNPNLEPLIIINWDGPRVNDQY